jgi:hypothetical protein
MLDTVSYSFISFNSNISVLKSARLGRFIYSVMLHNVPKQVEITLEYTVLVRHHVLLYSVRTMYCASFRVSLFESR